MDSEELYLNQCFISKAHQAKRILMKIVFSHSVKQGRNLLETCKEEYDYDLHAMTVVAREGEYPVLLPLSIIAKIMSMRGPRSSRPHRQIQFFEDFKVRFKFANTQ